MLPVDKIRLYKVLPRAAFILFLLATWQVGDWFMALEDPTPSQAGFASMMVGSAVAFFKFFMTDGEFKE